VVDAVTELRSLTNRLLMNKDATETAFKNAAAILYQFIHLAVHAFADDDPDRVLSDPRYGED
jgi:hypothetical protein